MPFACAAVIGIAIIWLCYLTAVQLVSGPKRDSTSKRFGHLPVPPRALTGNGAWPVLGHTILFLKLGVDMARLFPPEWKEIKWLKRSRRIGECYSVFVLGQWRVVISGEDRTKQLLDQTKLREGWAWSSTPRTLLGKTCLPLWDQKDHEKADYIRRMIEQPLSHSSVVKFAPLFAESAHQCIEQILDGNFIKRNVRNPISKISNHSDDESDGEAVKGGSEKVNWKALRSYTFDLIDGPILNLNKCSKRYSRRASLNKKTKRRSENEKSVTFEDDDVIINGDDMPLKRGQRSPRDMLILWMGRLKAGLVDIKVTYGAEWMHIWRLNWYGRALYARKYLTKVVREHVREREELVPVHHDHGHSIRDPFSSPLPLVTMTGEFFRGGESGRGGSGHLRVAQNRSRTHSESDVPQSGEDTILPLQPTSPPVTRRARAYTEPRTLVEGVPLVEGAAKQQQNPSSRTPTKKKKMMSLLDQLLRQEDPNGDGMTQVAITEISILIWMMMDAGQAWTANALNLVSTDDEACKLVQSELEHLEATYGEDRLFTSFVLSKMELLDALIYEAIRLCPPFLGGMKVVNETVDVGGFQIPKNTNVIFHNSSEREFDLAHAKGKRPEELGMQYPSVEIHGFLPLQGLEIPLMVLQTKVFLAVLLKDFNPTMSNKRTFLRLVEMAINQSHQNHSPCSSLSSSDSTHREVNNESSPPLFKAKSSDTWECVDLESGDGRVSLPPKRTKFFADEPAETHNDITDAERCRLVQEEQQFSTIPFPKPKRVIHIKHRRPSENVEVEKETMDRHLPQII